MGRVAFEEVSRHRVLFKSVPENWGLSACGTKHEATSRISLGTGEHLGAASSRLPPLLIVTGEAIPLRGLEGGPGLPGAPQDEAGLTRKFEIETSPYLLAAARESKNLCAAVKTQGSQK